jgi:tripartite-type tricarboxylate transporter receptor subunit TctC
VEAARAASSTESQNKNAIKGGKSVLRSFARAAALVLVCLSATQTVLAQDRYPSKPIRMIVTVAAGAPTDLFLRTVSQELQPRLGQPFVIDNRPGGNVMIGAEVCAKAAPDGYSFCAFSSDTMSINPHIFSNIPYDVDKDFKPVALMYYLIQGLIGSSSLPVNSVKELQALARARTIALNFGTLGTGTNPDVFRQWLNERWKTDIAGIPYKGANLVMNALIAGEIHLSRISLSTVGGQAKAGKVKLLAVGASKRSRVFPDVATYAEVGLDEFAEQVWWGMLAPAGTPEAAVKRMNDELVRLFREPKFLEYLDNQFLDPAIDTPEEFAVFLK